MSDGVATSAAHFSAIVAQVAGLERAIHVASYPLAFDRATRTLAPVPLRSVQQVVREQLNALPRQFPLPVVYYDPQRPSKIKGFMLPWTDTSPVVVQVAPNPIGTGGYGSVFHASVVTVRTGESFDVAIKVQKLTPLPLHKIDDAHMELLPGYEIQPDQSAVVFRNAAHGLPPVAVLPAAVLEPLVLWAAGRHVPAADNLMPRVYATSIFLVDHTVYAAMMMSVARQPATSLCRWQPASREAAEELLRALVRFVQAAEAAIELQHGDFLCTNILVDGNRRPLVIDPGYASFRYPGTLVVGGTELHDPYLVSDPFFFDMYRRTGHTERPHNSNLTQLFSSMAGNSEYTSHRPYFLPSDLVAVPGETRPHDPRNHRTVPPFAPPVAVQFGETDAAAAQESSSAAAEETSPSE